MTDKKKTKPRQTPDRHSKYMGLAWIHAAFSKDPSTQVGACIVAEDNIPLGSGYNGPPRAMDDNKIPWDRPSKENPDEYCKYDVVVHAEANAIDHSCQAGMLAGSTLYCTALPCPSCMREIVRKSIGTVVYMDFQSNKSSSLQNASWRDKSFQIASDGGVSMEEFKGSLGWLPDWIQKMKDMGVFEM
jgi:deoxycytidylate deaminase